MATSRSGFNIVVVKQCPFIRLLHWRNLPFLFGPHEWIPLHHRSIEHRPAASCRSYPIPFQECWSVSVIYKLPSSTPDHIHHQFETKYKLVLQSHHTPGLNMLTPSPLSSPSPQQHLQFLVSLFYSTAEEGNSV